MRTNNMKFETSEKIVLGFAWGFVSSVFLLLLVGLLLLVMGFAGASFAQESPQPRTFSSPVEASDALFQAAQKEDEPTLEAILGAGKEVTSSSDEVEDKLEREQFRQKYQQMHRLVQEPDGTTVLYIGAENWPFPDPVWSPRTENGTSIPRPVPRKFCSEELARMKPQRFKSARNSRSQRRTRRQNQLATTRLLNSPKPSHPLSTTNANSNSTSPFHGYYFRIVNGNSAAATNSSVSGGNPKKGDVTLVAYPAEYRSSGVKTFIVTRHDIVYENDLGPSTTTVAPSVRQKRAMSVGALRSRCLDGRLFEPRN